MQAFSQLKTILIEVEHMSKVMQFRPPPPFQILLLGA